ncbi:hypothetical protein ACFTWF_04175 [Rhodococcus sp. NPDC056960]|uniref:hypothetical protein n=1 Tax=Rhodococcus sp. NPDC056960 TaxID=3345982 RepID=UPI003639F698
MTDDLQLKNPSVANEDKRGSWMKFGVANVAVITVLAVTSWWLLIDRDWNLFGWEIYPEPFTSWLFWCLITVVFVGFSLQFHGFERVRQPTRGLVLIALTCAISVAITFLLSHPFGHIAPDLSSSRENGAGYATGAQWVLYAFLLYVMSVVNWNHWPWTDDRVAQPWKGLAEIAGLLLPTTALYAVFALPNLTSESHDSFVELDTSIGFFYACILSVVLTGNLTENWPWRLAGTPARIAIAATIGNVAFGAVMYFALGKLVRLLVGEDNTDLIGETISSMPAQFGVCWVLWAILWPNVFGNIPVAVTTPAKYRYVCRLAITFVLAVGTFLTYYFLIAGPILHEPTVGSNMAGNALGFIDWCILWSLWYVLCLKSWGLNSFVVEPSNSD